MWVLIFGLVFLLVGASAVCLVSRFYKLEYVKKWGGDKKSARIAFAAAPVAVVTVLLYLGMGYMNTIIALIHFTFFWILGDIAYYFLWKKRGKTGRYFIVAAASFAVTAVYLSFGWYQAHHVWHTSYEVASEKAVGDLHIVYFADSHVGTTFDGKGFAGQMKEIQAENPDVVIVAGDYVDDDTSRQDMADACAALGSLKTAYGVYLSFGNHDKGYFGAKNRGYTADDLRDELKKNGVHLLEDESVLIDGRFYLIGRQDRAEEQRGGTRASMEDLTKDIDMEKFSIVIDHQPNDYDAQEKSGVDLVLSGHTHGGQMIPVNYVGEWTGVNDKTYGIEKRGNTNFIVTSGISDWSIYFKTGCRSEYAIVDIKGK